MSERRQIDWTPLVSALALVAAVLVMFATSPLNEQFWWTDSATFALNGEFVRDYIASGLPRSPMAFANAWFLRYPALTISLYPPVFPLAEAAVFAVFGFSHAAAQATVAAFTMLAAWGAYRVGRTAMPAMAAAAFALVLLATPGVLFWSRQVMMETPSLAFLLLGASALLRYQAFGGPMRLLFAVAMVLAGTYTKQTAVFAAPAFALALLVGSGPGLLRRPAVWVAALAGVVGLVPLVLFTLKFAPQLVDIAAAQGSSGNVSRLSVATLTQYGRALPEITGWLPLLGGAGYVALVAIRGWSSAAERNLAVLMLCWFITDYGFITLIGHFEVRYGLMLAIPLATFTVLLVVRALGMPFAPTAALAGGVVFFAASILSEPVPWVGGFGAVAASIVRDTAQNDVILFDGEDSKSLMFSLRTRTPSAKVYVLRAEKLLVDYHFTRDWGIKDRDLSPDDIAAMIDRFGVSLVVLQPGFWTDQPSMARLEAYVNSDRFELLEQIEVPAEEAYKRATIRIFRNKEPKRASADTIRQLEARP